MTDCASRSFDPAEKFFNFSLALEKICAYIRNCRRVPEPGEKKFLQRRRTQPALFAWSEHFSRNAVNREAAKENLSKSGRQAASERSLDRSHL